MEIVLQNITYIFIFFKIRVLFPFTTNYLIFFIFSIFVLLINFVDFMTYVFKIFAVFFFLSFTFCLIMFLQQIKMMKLWLLQDYIEIETHLKKPG